MTHLDKVERFKAQLPDITSQQIVHVAIVRSVIQDGIPRLRRRVTLVEQKTM